MTNETQKRIRKHLIWTSVQFSKIRAGFFVCFHQHELESGGNNKKSS